MQDASDLEKQREYLRIWQTNGPLLDAIRDREIREADTIQSIQMFAEAFRIALRDLPPCTSSGLVEWQAAMMRLRDRG